MTINLLNYKKQVKKDIVYKDKKNLIINKHAAYEYDLIERFEKEHGITVEDLEDDNEYFDFKANEAARMQEPKFKKLRSLLKNFKR